MKEEPRYMQKQYEKQADTTLYDQSREKSKEDRHLYERNLNLDHRTAKNGNSARGRKQAGVTVLKGNKSAVFSNTRGDDARPLSRPQGVVGVNEEASSLGAPIGPGKDLPAENTAGSVQTHEGEQ